MKKHKHWFQFVRKFMNGTHAEFVCLCGEERVVEIKKQEKK